MSESAERTGRCLCGAVRFTIKHAKDEVGVCHCSMCRRWSGGPLFAMECDGEVSFEGLENITRYRSSEWAERGFCKRCGSNLFYRILQSGHYAMSTGTFNEEAGLRLTTQIFVDDKPSYYELANRTRMMTGAEVFAAYAPPPEPGERD